MERYTVVLNRRDLIEEIRKAPDEKVSFTEATAEVRTAILVKYFPSSETLHFIAICLKMDVR